MSAVVMLAAMLALVGVLAVLARRQMERERKRERLRALLQPLAAEMERFAETIGRALLPSIQSATRAVAAFADAWNRAASGGKP